MRGVIAAAAIAAVGAAAVAQEDHARVVVGDRVATLTRDSGWRLVEQIPMKFRTHHPQGMVKIGGTFFVSSVEITVRTRPLPQPFAPYDRDTGEGVGHLFKFDGSGRLLGSSRLGEGSMYHPGGIDYDGRYLWVPVAEYRPHSRSVIYRVDPETLQAEPVLRFDDHIGGVARDWEHGTLHGVSWGSRLFYRWTVRADGTVDSSDAPAASPGGANPAHYIDYQDCAYAGRGRMLCTGLAEIRGGGDGPSLRLGGVELVDLREGRPLHQLPVPLWTSGGLPMTRNPAWFEASGAGLRAYFMPEDDTSTLYVYEVETGPR